MTRRDQHHKLAAAAWLKSSYSSGSANCVEVAEVDNNTAVRDTKHRELGALVFGSNEWEIFIKTTKS